MVLVRTTVVTKTRAAVTEARSQLAAATPDLAAAEKLREDTRAGDRRLDTCTGNTEDG